MRGITSATTRTDHGHTAGAKMAWPALMLRNLYAHPNGQIPAYEWNFSDVNPPVHAWATLFLYNIEKELGRSDLRFLERSFQGLMQNFNWWVCLRS